MPMTRRHSRAPRRAAAFSKITVISVGFPCSSAEDQPTPCGGAYGTPPSWRGAATTAAAAAAATSPPWVDGVVDDADLDALDALGWLADPPPPSALVRAASDDVRADGALEF